MRKVSYLLPALGLMGLIFWLSSHPAPESLKRFPMFAGMKVVHMIEYGLLAYLWIWGLARATCWSWRNVALTAILITSLWGISDEIHQSLVPGRTARMADAITNLLAALGIAGITTFIRGMKAKLCYKKSFTKHEEAL